MNIRRNCLLPETSTDRVTKHRQKAKDAGYKRREYKLTDDEHIALKKYLAELRELAQ